MREQMRQRLEDLKREFQTGQTRLRDIEQQGTQLRETLLRISGAVQVLEELLAEEKSQDVEAANGHS
jgi:predicted nuclease with TOPRIM domain